MKKIFYLFIFFDDFTLSLLGVPPAGYFLFETHYVSLLFLCLCSQEADTDDQQGTLTFEEFTVFYKMMSLRRDLYLLLMCFSEKKDHLTAEELGNFLRVEQKVSVISVPDQNL